MAEAVAMMQRPTQCTMGVEDAAGETAVEGSNAS